MSSGISTVWLFVHCSRTHWSFKKCWFLRRKEIWRTCIKTLGARTRVPPPKKKYLTTAPSLRPKYFDQNRVLADVILSNRLINT